MTDRNSLAGIVRAHEAARVTGVRLVVGCRLDLSDGLSLLVSRPSGRLCLALPAASLGRQRAGMGKCRLGWDGLVAYGDGLLTVLLPD